MSTTVNTPVFRASYVNIIEPREGPDGGEPKYGLSMIFPKGTDMAKVEDAIAEAAAATWGKRIPKNLRKPLRDGDKDREDRPEYENSIFMNASSARKPGVIDSNRDTMINLEEFYSGCFAMAQVRFFTYDKKGNKGVGCGLNNLWKLKDGDHLDGSMDAETAFADEKDVDLDDLG